MRLKPLLFPLLSVLLSVGSLSAFATTFKVATLSPDGSSWMQHMRKAGKDIKTATEGRVKFKFYPGGVMGDDKAVLRKMRVRQLHGIAAPGGSLVTIAPDSQIYGLAFTFQNMAEVDYIRQHMDVTLLKHYESNGLVPFGFAEGGFAYIMSNRAIRTPNDLRQSKAWLPSSDPVTINASKAIGISPIPLSIGDVLPSLQTGLIDTIATSPIAALALQWHTQVTHLTKVPLLYFYAVLALDQKAFKKISSADQVTTRRIMGAAFKKIDQQNRIDNENAFAALKTQGIEILELSKEEKALWQELQEPMNSVILNEGKVSPSIVEQFNKHIQSARQL